MPPTRTKKTTAAGEESKYRSGGDDRDGPIWGFDPNQPEDWKTMHEKARIDNEAPADERRYRVGQ